MWWLVFMLYSTNKINLWAMINIFSCIAALFKQKISAVGFRSGCRLVRQAKKWLKNSFKVP